VGFTGTDDASGMAQFSVLGQAATASLSSSTPSASLELRGKAPLPAAGPDAGAEAVASDPWTIHKRHETNLFLKVGAPAGACSEAQAVMDPLVMVDPAWEQASEWMVVQKAYPDSDGWMAPSTDWKLHWTDATPARFDLRGTASNRCGIGARVRVVAGGRSQHREVSSSLGIKTGDAMEPHFGPGATAAVDTIEVRWPSGAVEVSAGPFAADRVVLLTEGTPLAVPVIPRPTVDALPRLHPCRPNSTSGSTTIRFDLARRARVTATLHDAAGRRVQTLLSSQVWEAGRYTLSWNGRDALGRRAPSALYCVSLASDGERQTQPLVLIR
jgi:hypothetical protein